MTYKCEYHQKCPKYIPEGIICCFINRFCGDYHRYKQEDNAENRFITTQRKLREQETKMLEDKI